MRNIDSGIRVLLKKKLPINPTSMTIPIIKMSLLIAVYHSAFAYRFDFFLRKIKQVLSSANLNLLVMLRFFCIEAIFELPF